MKPPYVEVFRIDLHTHSNEHVATFRKRDDAVAYGDEYLVGDFTTYTLTEVPSHKAAEPSQ